MALVSVVIPAYNASETLAATLRSVLQQTFTDLEILLVDDGSDDDTRAIAESFAATDRRLVVISQPNAGVAAARNNAIASACGEWIATLDADDLWHPRKIELQLRAAEEEPGGVAMVYAWSRRIDEKDRVLADLGAPMHRGRIFEQFLATNFIRNASSAMIRRSAIIEAGGFDSGLQAVGAHGAEDIKLYLAVTWRHQAAVAPFYLTGYRSLSDSMSQAPYRMRRSIELVLTELETRHPEIASDLFRLARMNYDLYGASIARTSGDWKTFAKFLGKGLRSKPLDACVLLACNGLWAIEERFSKSAEAPDFYALPPDRPLPTHLQASLVSFQTRSASRAARRSRRMQAGARQLAL